jgi:hypothetical protein
LIENQNQDIVEENKEKISILKLIKSAIEYFFTSKNNQLPEDNSITNNSLIINNNNQENLLPSSNTIKGIISKSQQTAEAIIPQIQQTTEQLINQGLNQLNIAKNNLNNKLNNPDDPFQVQLLIWAAINYFFNEKKSTLSNNSKKSFLPSFSATEIVLINDEIADPWLSWEDLYNTESKDTATEDSFILVDQVSIELESFNNIVENQEILTNISSQKNTVLATTKTAENKTIINNKKTNNLSNKKVTFEEEIEVKVIEIKYEKHFLEIILEKLDRLILWLEETLIRIVNKVKLMTKKYNE